MIVVGIDPGLAGGLAFLSAAVVEVLPIRVSGKGIDAPWLAEWLEACAPDLVVVENSPPFKQGRTSAHTSGRGLGRIEGVLAALGIRSELVRSQDWKKSILAGTAKDKDAAIAWCMRVYPGVELVLKGCRKAHDGMADALCIATYGQRVLLPKEA